MLTAESDRRDFLTCDVSMLSFVGMTGALPDGCFLVDLRFRVTESLLITEDFELFSLPR